VHFLIVPQLPLYLPILILRLAVRAMSLPRSMLGEILEIAIVLDRAVYLEESGLFSKVDVCRLFPDDVSMRNLTILAYPMQQQPQHIHC
jgi:hypothetical protein